MSASLAVAAKMSLYQRTLGVDAIARGLAAVASRSAGIPLSAFVNPAADDNSDGIEAAIKVAQRTKSPLLLAPGAFYRHSRTIMAQDSSAGAHDFVGIYGPSQGSCGFICTTDNIPQMQFGYSDTLPQQYSVLQGFSLSYLNMQAETNTAAKNMVMKLSSQCEFKDLLISNGYEGMNTSSPSVQGPFSCIFQNIRFLNSYNDNVIGGSAGSGNNIYDIYASSANRPRVVRLISVLGQIQGHAAQLNGEHSAVINTAIRLDSSSQVYIDAVNIEDITVFDPSSWQGMISGSALFPTINALSLGYPNYGGYRVSAIAYNGDGTATATLNGLASSSFIAAGHGITDGFIQFSGSGGGSPYAGPYTVVSATKTTATFSGVDGTQTFNPTGSSFDYGVAYRCPTISSFPQIVAIFGLSGAAQRLQVSGIQHRGTIICGPTETVRNQIVRPLRALGNNKGWAKVDNVGTRGQFASCLGRENQIIAVSSDGTTSTYWLQDRHNMEVGERFCTSGTGLSAIAAGAFAGSWVISNVDDTGYAVMVANAVTSTALTPSANTTTTAVFGSTQSLGVTLTRARDTNGLVTFVLSGAMGWRIGTDLHVYCTADTTFNVKNQLVFVSADGKTVQIQTTTTGSVVSAVADTTICLMAIEDPTYQSGNTMTGSSNTQRVQAWGEQFQGTCFIAANAALAAGTSTTATVTTLIGARPGDRIQASPVSTLPTGIIVTSVCTAKDTLNTYATNTGILSANLPATIVTMTMTR